MCDISNLELLKLSLKIIDKKLDDKIYENMFQFLQTKTEDIEEYELIQIVPDGEENVTIDLTSNEFAYVVPNPNNTTSAQNQGLYKILFRYGGGIRPNSREFCKKMIAANKLYSYENIQAASNLPVNSGLGKEGASTYDIWEWCGGKFCHNFWVKEIYFRKREKGRFLPNNLLTNDVKISQSQADKIGIVNTLVNKTIAPINTPSRGAYNP